QRVDGSPFEEKQLSRLELGDLGRILHPKRTPARQNVEIFVTGCVVVWRSSTVDTKDPRAGCFLVGEVLVKKERICRFGKSFHNLGDLETGRCLGSGPA